jgi:hypothetical protein
VNDLQDFYAGLAMHALIKFAIDENLPREKIADVAFNMAEAMLKEKKKREPND